ncbi:MAG: hypothetical protein AAGK14_00290 [Verrucomicrobiota bacterium]
MLIPESFTALAYIGPGLGAGAVATILGLIAAFFLGLFAILWYPIKRMIKGKKKPTETNTKSETETTGEKPSSSDS